MRHYKLHSMKALSAKINTPCHEDWNKMKVGMHSRHCDSCAKSVMDFTQMSRDEIIEFLLTHRNQSVCGRMHQGQMDFHAPDILVTIHALSKRKISRNNAFFMLSLSSWLLVSCTNPQSDAPVTSSYPTDYTTKVMTPITDISHTDSTQTDSITPSTSTTNDTKTHPNPIDIPTVGDIQVLTGEVAIDHPVEAPPPDSLYPGFAWDQSQRDTIVRFPEKMAEYPGGAEKLISDLRSKMTYPAYEKEGEIEGTIYVQFIVSSTGVVSHPEVLRDVTDALNFKKEALRIISEMPRWIPAVHQGKNVPSYFVLPIKFQLP
ncbi:hypothetical protein F8C82_01070 [Phaeocystidibacter marisrubri]|uniref:TonB C-terminal domain-containing protein n=2 Tax=Phaeocystidibacter marisrubri TaxID=1577780 RepID=A0A6L3ZGN6_9FLAO|nr:hypothetical protein F8C82_01070 [Phaeocystidibacter marisrubri]